MQLLTEPQYVWLNTIKQITCVNHWIELYTLKHYERNQKNVNILNPNDNRKKCHLL